MRAGTRCRARRIPRRGFRFRRRAAGTRRAPGPPGPAGHRSGGRLRPPSRAECFSGPSSPSIEGAGEVRGPAVPAAGRCRPATGSPGRGRGARVSAEPPRRRSGTSSRSTGGNAPRRSGRPRAASSPPRCPAGRGTTCAGCGAPAPSSAVRRFCAAPAWCQPRLRPGICPGCAILAMRSRPASGMSARLEPEPGRWEC